MATFVITVTKAEIDNRLAAEGRDVDKLYAVAAGNGTVDAEEAQGELAYWGGVIRGEKLRAHYLANGF